MRIIKAVGWVMVISSLVIGLYLTVVIGLLAVVFKW